MSRSHGLMGCRTPQRAERDAGSFGLDEEMLRATSDSDRLGGTSRAS